MLIAIIYELNIMANLVNVDPEVFDLIDFIDYDRCNLGCDCCPDVNDCPIIRKYEEQDEDDEE